MQEPFEVISVTRSEVACDGGDGPLGHPRVYLYVNRESGQIQCPYCSRLYVLKANAAPAIEAHS
jgi:uncharacterized Zn-finger protein